MTGRGQVEEHEEESTSRESERREQNKYFVTSQNMTIITGPGSEYQYQDQYSVLSLHLLSAWNYHYGQIANVS